jgi:hypothetical protein
MLVSGFSGSAPLQIIGAMGQVIVRHNRWHGLFQYAIDVENTTVATWDDNGYDTGGTIPPP